MVLEVTQKINLGRLDRSAARAPRVKVTSRRMLLTRETLNYSRADCFPPHECEHSTVLYLVLKFVTSQMICDYCFVTEIWWDFIHCLCGPGSSVGIATCYGLDGLGIESRWGRDIPHPSTPALPSTQPTVQWVKSLFSRE